MSGMSKIFKYAVIGAGILALPALAAGPILVSQKGRTFAPGKLTVSRGDVVRFLNDDEYTHHVFMKSTSFNYDSGEIEAGKFAETAMTVPGSFEVRCAIHPKMRLVLEVK